MCLFIAVLHYRILVSDCATCLAGRTNASSRVPEHKKACQDLCVSHSSASGTSVVSAPVKQSVACKHQPCSKLAVPPGRMPAVRGRYPSAAWPAALCWRCKADWIRTNAQIANSGRMPWPRRPEFAMNCANNPLHTLSSRAGSTGLLFRDASLKPLIFPYRESCRRRHIVLQAISVQVYDSYA